MSRCCSGGGFPMSLGLGLLAAGLVSASAWIASAALPRTVAETSVAALRQDNDKTAPPRRNPGSAQEKQDAQQSQEAEQTVEKSSNAERIKERSGFDINNTSFSIHLVIR